MFFISNSVLTKLSFILNILLIILISFYIFFPSFRSQLKKTYLDLNNFFFEKEINLENFDNLKINKEYKYLDKLKKLKFVAHRGGPTWLAGDNSIETMLKGYDNGYRFFEIDLAISNSKKLYCYHGYYNDGISITNFNNKEIEDSINKQNLKICTFEKLLEFLKDKKDAYIIIDAKGNFRDIYSQIYKLISKKEILKTGLNQRLIPQIYFFDQIKEISKFNINFASPIFTVYLNKKPLDKILDFAQLIGIKIVTVPSSKFDNFIKFNSFSEELNIFLHGGYNMDIIPILEKYSLLGVTGFYNKTNPQLNNK